MKTVLMLAYYYPPDSSSGVYRTLYFANHLIKTKDWQPIVLTLDPGSYSREQGKDYSLLKKIDPNVQIVRTKGIQLREKIIGLRRKPERKSQDIREALNKNDTPQKRKFQKIIDIITEEILAFPDRQVGWIPYAIKGGMVTARKNKVDLIYSSGSPWSSHLIGMILKRILKVPLVLDYRDPWNQNTFSGSKSRLYLSISKKLEARILGNANAVICNTNSLKNVLSDNYNNLNKEMFHVIPNGFEEEDLTPENTVKIKKQKNEFVFIHVGALYGNRKITNFVLSIKHLEKSELLENSKFILIGVGEEVEQEIIAICGKDVYRRKFLTMHRIEHKKCIAYLKSSDCFLLFQQGTTLQVPRKIYEYIALKKPILAITPNKGETAKLILENNLGVVVDDGVTDIREGIVEISENYDKYVKSIAENKAMAKYDNLKLTEDLEKVFLEVTKT